MNEMIQEAVLTSIDDIDEQQLFAEYEVLMALADVYTKAALIQESAGLVFDGEGIVQEADDASSEKSESKLKNAFSKAIGSGEKGAERGIAGVFMKIVRFIGKAFGILRKKIARFVRVLTNRKTDQVVTLEYNLETVDQASESLVEATALLNGIFESKGSDKTAVTKYNNFIATATKTIGKAKRSYKDTIEACTAAMKSIDGKIEAAQKDFKQFEAKANEFKAALVNDVAKNKEDQTLANNRDSFSINITMQDWIIDYSKLIKKFNDVSVSVAQSIGIKKADNLIKDEEAWWQANTFMAE